MKQYIRNLRLAAVLVLAFALTALAQAPPFGGPGPVQAKPMGPVRVQVVIAKYEGDKKVTSLPYSMSVTANGDRVSLKMGSQIPMPTTSYPGSGTATPVTSFT